MRLRALLVGGLLALGGLAAGLPARAQEKAAPPPLPEPTTEQKLDRMTANFTATVAGSIAYARSVGQSPDQYGRFLGQLFATTWPAKVTPGGLLYGYYVNASPWKALEYQVLEVSDSVARARTNRPWLASLGSTQQFAGVTGPEIDRVLELMYAEIAVAHELVWEQKPDGDMLLLTVRRKSAGP